MLTLVYLILHVVLSVGGQNNTSLNYSESSTTNRSESTQSVTAQGQVGITLSEEGLEWTPNGFNVTPVVTNFVDERNVNVDYLFTRKDGSIVPWTAKPYKDLPHILEEFDKTWEGDLTATASNEKISCCCWEAQCCGYNARTRIQIKKQVSIKSLKPVWTQDGLSVTLEVENFDNTDGLKITYSYSRGDVANIGNQNESTPWTNLSYSDQPHLLKGIDNSCRGILTATASDGIYSTPLKSENIEKQVSIELTRESWKWTPDGLSVTPEVQHFDDLNEVNIIYSYNISTSSTPHEITRPGSERTHLLEGIDNTWGGILTATASDGRYKTQPYQIQIEREFDLQTFRRGLITSYQDQLKEIVLLPWNEIFHKPMNVDDIFVEQELQLANSNIRNAREGWDDSGVLKAKEYLVSLDDPNQEGLATRIHLEGPVGSGKSTLLCKLAYDWATDIDSPFKAKFELVFLLRMKSLDHNMSLFDAISKQHSLDESKRSGLCNFLKQNQEKILILMDGWDEASIGKIESNNSYAGTMTIEQILARQRSKNLGLPKTCVIISTRPHKPLGTIKSHYVTVNVNGFSEEKREEYTKQFFFSANISKEDVEKFNNEVNSSSMLLTLAETPLMLMLLCIFWGQHKHFPNALYDLYQQFVDMIVKRYNNTCKSEKELKESQVFQRKLGKVAFEGLLSNQNIQKEVLEFSENELDDLGLGVGLLKKEWRFEFVEKTIISFAHKSFQEFFAGKNLAKLFDGRSTDFSTLLKKIETWDLVLQKFEVLRFCCGASQSAAKAVIQHVIHVFDGEYKDRNAKPAIACRVDHHVHIKTEISVGCAGLLHHTTDQAECLPILTLLQESKLKDDPSLISVFEKSIFSDEFLSVHIKCDAQSLPLFTSFIESKVGKITSEHVRSVSLHYVPNVKQRRITNVPGIIAVTEPVFVPNGLSSMNIASMPKLSILFIQIHFFMHNDDFLCQLSKSPAKSLRHVEFDMCYIGDGIKHIAAILKHHPISCLILGQIGSLSKEEVITLSQAFPISSPLLRLDLSCNAPDIDSLVHILKHCQYLQVLGLIQCGLNANDIKTLSDHLAKTLMELDLWGNDVGSSTESLTRALQNCKQLEKLTLSQTGMNSHHISTLSELFSSTPNLIELNLESNSIGISIELLTHHLQHCHQLSVLDLGKTGLGDAGATTLANSFKHWPDLTVLSINDNYVGITGLDAVLSHIHQLSKLTEFKISFSILQSQCSDLVTKCLHATETKMNEEIQECWVLCKLDINKIRCISKAASV